MNCTGEFVWNPDRNCGLIPISPPTDAERCGIVEPSESIKVLTVGGVLGIGPPLIGAVLFIIN